MTYLPLKYESSNIFPKETIAVRPDVHIMLSSGTLPDKTNRKAETTAPVFELSYSRKGSVYGEVNSTPIELRPGYSSMGFLGQATGTSEYDADKEIQLYSIWVSPSAFDNFCKSVSGKGDIGFHSFQKKMCYYYDFKCDALEESIIKKLDSCFSQKTDQLNNLLLESQILELLSINIEKLLCQDLWKSQINQLSKCDMEQLKYAREILLNRLTCPPTLFELSHMVHMNDCKLKRSFKQCFGKTVYEYVREQRLEKAFSLLCQDHYNVSETAFAVGYTNVSHFSEAFKKKFGITPGELSKSNKRGVSQTGQSY
ncbi:helix-turn-helix domain-containing protein [Lacrimispora sp.]|uniref:helix-turn-helix domain-containing protein n=1 Tax=Lacrimispora sp. TaxID=2719234 RepID=UPI002FD966B9